ncbi:hypothetical protein BASA61_005221 [Batrachochytrium salamandrivorans]|nr:hypothetical protein BASA61_005221 [Batrachochytrium salamandrivorans]
MQFFYLFSFVVAASYAAALPQPAELSEKYSNNVDTTLASGLEARSYQPGLNSPKNSATLTLLKRRDVLRDHSESDPSFPSTSGPNKTFGSYFSTSDVSSVNLASTINRVKDDAYIFFKDGELAADKIGDPVRDMVASYFRRYAYVTAALSQWVHISVDGIVDLIKSSLGEDEHSKEEPDLTEKIKKLEVKFNADLNAIGDATSNILKDVGFFTENFQNINKLFGRTFNSRWTLLWELFPLLKKFEAGRAIEWDLTSVVHNVSDFLKEQKKLFGKIMEKLEAASSQ